MIFDGQWLFELQMFNFARSQDTVTLRLRTHIDRNLQHSQKTFQGLRMRTALLLRAEYGSAVKSGCVKNTVFHPKHETLRRRYEGSENPGKLRNIRKKQEGAS